MKEQAIAVRAALERSGLDHGPVSVHDKMKAMGLAAPSTAALARIFRAAGIARAEPKKRPRAAWRRFVYPAPNACWQLDATEYVLTRGRTCVIFQLIDDHSRLALASHVSWTETADAAITVMDKAIAAHGVPQRLLSDNGAALNPTRRGMTGKLVTHVTALGVLAITGKPYKPTTQGKNERFHQTLFRFLDKQPLADTLDDLQQHVDAFDRIYNTERPHQALPGRLTPQQAWDATAPAEAPRPRPASEADTPTNDTGQHTRTVTRAGAITIHSTRYMIGKAHAGTTVHAAWDDATVDIFDDRGAHLITFPRPPKGTLYVGNGRHRTSLTDPTPSPMS